MRKRLEKEMTKERKHRNIKTAVCVGVVGSMRGQSDLDYLMESIESAVKH